MKKVVFVFIFFFAAIFTGIAQEYQEVVYLKNGSIIRGFIIEIIPDEYLDIRTTNGRIRSIEMYDIDRIVKERVRTESRTQNERRENISSYNNNVRVPQNNARAPQNNARAPQNEYRYSENNNRYSQNYNQYDSRNRTNNNNFYDDRYYTPQNSVHFGVKAGLNLADIEASDTKYKAGIHGGIFGEFKFNNFALQPELLFSMQGAKIKEVDAGIDYTIRMNMNYLNIPLMAKYYVMEGLCFEIGPQLGILLSAKAKTEASVALANVSTTVDMKSYMKDIDFSLNFGLSYQIPHLPLGFYARYSLGITDLTKEIESGDEPGKNRVFQAGAFVKF